MERLYELLHDAQQAGQPRGVSTASTCRSSRRTERNGDEHRTSARAIVGPAAVLGLVLFVVAGALALSIDVPRTTYGIKSDEATYVAAALSAAYDGDLSRSSGAISNALPACTTAVRTASSSSAAR